MDGIYEPKDINEIKGLPDAFNYEYYRKLSKERDLSRWAFEFAQRQDGIDNDKLLVDTGGITYKTGFDNIKTIWRNGVYIGGNLNTHDCRYYLDEINNQYLQKAKAVFVPDGEENKYKDKITGYQISSTIDTPETEHCKSWHSKLGKTYFPTNPLCHHTCRLKI